MPGGNLICDGFTINYHLGQAFADSKLSLGRKVEGAFAYRPNEAVRNADGARATPLANKKAPSRTQAKVCAYMRMVIKQCEAVYL